MMMFIVLLTMWLASAPATYLMVRHEHRRPGRSWTQADRLFWACFSLLYGPVMLMVVALIMMAEKIGDTAWAQREAKW